MPDGSRPYVQRFAVKDFGCIQNAVLDLTPLHALIGPNDSGKTTLLRGLEYAMEFAAFGQNSLHLRSLLAESQPLPLCVGGTALTVHLPPEVILRYELNHPGPMWQTSWRRGQGNRVFQGLVSYTQAAGGLNAAHFPHELLKGARRFRLDPDALRQHSTLLTDSGIDEFFKHHGRGLPGLLDRVLSRGDRAFLDIGEEIRKLFPTVERVGLKPTSANEKQVVVVLKDGTEVSPEYVSDGLLYMLAYLAIGYEAPYSMLLVEEPENGLHPARIKEVVKVLRHISKTTAQVVIATHSPLVVNELAPEEVSVVTQDPESGTKVTPIRETVRFEERSKVYALGELWLSYADGNLEAPLIEGVAKKGGEDSGG